ncbi:hypothetical protein [Bizionia myxarmorum]|uniref:Collagen-like protein n=1 Tax=Bizionia myxarmorum TaxID=291186 RepID=A0A5D0REF9_9FLAO|nr:hypothetical protein [Bizionia myxarmorum]TYB79389.1 hypothetical protein ES674_06345 [Bizionia myxarmorum]
MKTIKKTIQTTISKSKYVLLTLLVAFSFSCSPEDGNDGAVGPAGPAGSNGQDGNANVIASDWIPISLSDGSASQFDVIDTNINAETLSSSLIVVYGKFTAQDIVGIPFTYSNRTYYFVAFQDTNTFRILGRSLDGTSESFNDISDVRYIIIPSNNSTRGNIDYTKMSYQEVINHFDLEE